jgi:hypothetical protein
MVSSSKTQTKNQGVTTQPADKTAAIPEVEAKVFDGMSMEDLGTIKKGIDEIRAYANSSMNECILVANAFQKYHYTSRDGKLRDSEQDKRVREGARQRGAESIRNLRLYFRRIEEELRGAQKII